MHSSAGLAHPAMALGIAFTAGAAIAPALVAVTALAIAFLWHSRSAAGVAWFGGYFALPGVAIAAASLVVEA